MRLTTWSVLVCVLAIMVGSVASADASGDLDAVIVVGTSADYEKRVAATAARDALRADGREVIERTFSEKDVAGIKQCLRTEAAWPCVSGIVRDKALKRVSYVTIDPHAERVVKITQRLITAQLAYVVAGQRYCEQCTDDTLTASVAELTKELLDRVAIGTGRTVLVVKSVPRNARVSLDGDSIGATDLHVDIAPGNHVVTIERDGYERLVRTFEATEGRTEEIIVTLRPAAVAAPTRSAKPEAFLAGDPHTRRSSRTLPVTLVSLGIAAVVSGIVFVAVDEDAVAAPNTQAQDLYTDTARAGLALIGAGGVVGGVGAYLWWKRSRSPRGASIAPTRGGAMVGWSRSF